MEHSMIRAALLLVLLCVSSGAYAAPTASFVATASQGVGSVTNCVAPCAVHFDATATTDSSYSRPFHSLLYIWDFGDPDSGNWSVGSVYEGGGTDSKNTDTGPIAAHVYDAPGTYTATLTVRNPNSETGTANTTITVVAPETYFASTDTWCVRDTSAVDFTGCPLDTTPGGSCEVQSSHCITQSNALTAMSTAGATSAKKWVLFQRGGSWTGRLSGLANAADSVGLISAFGSGAKPIFSFELELAEGWVARDLDTDGLCNMSDCDVGNDLYGYTTMYSIDVTVGTTPGKIFLGGASGAGVEEVTEKVHNSVIGGNFTTGGENFVSGQYGVFMGNMWNFGGSDPTNNYYIRSQQFKHALVSRNRLYGHASIIDNTWSFRNDDDEWDPATDDQKAAEYNLVRRNVWDENPGTGYLRIRLCPDSGCNCNITGTLTCNGTGENNCGNGQGETVRVQNWIFEENLTRLESGTASGDKQSVYNLFGGDITVRNEILKADAGVLSSDNFSFVEFGGDSVGVQSTDGGTCTGNVEVDGNNVLSNTTVYVTTPGYSGDIRFCAVDGFGTGCPDGICQCSGNLAVVTSCSGCSISNAGAFTVTGQPSVVTSDIFDGTMPAQGSGGVGDFIPSTATAAINAGRDCNPATDTSGQCVLVDARDLCRPDATEWDAGAVERGASACSISSTVIRPIYFRGTSGGGVKIP